MNRNEQAYFERYPERIELNTEHARSTFQARRHRQAREDGWREKNRRETAKRAEREAQ